ncbi:unnamed protein product [Clonostachys byssicola]|uniref:Uncharacterized protein n=1 Tax=Clonostachys byssicola TaxID=160290 RepID=A0A9N9XYW4_9HYPO|nr:unnamed protein product [Clonostachys byssicola]
MGLLTAAKLLRKLPWVQEAISCKRIELTNTNDQREQLLIDIARDVFDYLRINRKEIPQAFSALINMMKATNILNHAMGLVDRLTNRPKRYHLFEKTTTAAAAYNESDGRKRQTRSANQLSIASTIGEAIDVVLAVEMSFVLVVPGTGPI